MSGESILLNRRNSQNPFRATKRTSGKERVQALYLLKTKQVETVLNSSVGTESSHSTKVAKSISEWWVESAIKVGKSTGRTALIPEWAVERLKQELLEPEGFSSYEEVRLWLAELGIQVKYDVVHNLVHEKLKADKKVAETKSSEQEPGAVENFELAQKLISVFKGKKSKSKV